jgi:hypothetical protein
MSITDFKISATVVLTEMPVDVELSVDKVHWTLADYRSASSS